MQDANSGYQKVEVVSTIGTKQFLRHSTDFIAFCGCLRTMMSSKYVQTDNGCFNIPGWMANYLRLWRDRRLFSLHRKNKSTTGTKYNPFSNAGVTLKPEKCWLYKDTMNYLGHVVRQMQLKTVSRKTVNYRRRNTPQNVANWNRFSFLATLSDDCYQTLQTIRSSWTEDY